MTHASFPAAEPTAAVNLRRLLLLRNIAIVAQVSIVLVAVYALGMGLPLHALLATIAALLGINILTWLRLHRPWPVSDAELFAQLSLDVAALTVLLYFSGGSTNPFVLLYLLPITLSAAALPGFYTWAMAAVTIACYSLLMFFYVPLPNGHAAHGGASAFGLHVFGMWLGFVASAALIAYFVVKMGETLRARDHALAALRENELRNERIVALATLAAGAAHELGTPLSTVAVLAKELECEAPDADSRDRLRVLREQVDRCKGILSTLSVSAGQARAEAGRSLPLDQYVEEVITRFRDLRPAAVVQHTLDGPRPAPVIVTEQTLSQAIMNILNNAADASPETVEITARWTTEALTLEVCDRGPGLPATVQAKAGKVVFSTKEAGQGMGLGLFLAHATLNRFGGAVDLYNREGGGACTRLSLPLANLRIG
jgi:two-component system sensor histidine kinase RegB